MNYFTARWSTLLVIISLVATLACLAWVAYSQRFLGSPSAVLIMRVLIPGVLLLCALYTVRGYSVNGETLYIHRLFWRTEISLAGLRSVEIVPEAMKRSIRIFGNGGLYAFTGYYRNAGLGTYRAFVTDFKATVVVHLAERVIVVSPLDGGGFVEAVCASGEARKSECQG